MKTLNKTIVSGCILMAFFMAFSGCTPVIENSLTSDAVCKPFSGLNVAPKRFTIPADRDTVIRTASGTQITFQANSLVDASNNPVKGSVDLAYTEYQNATDILVSGIQMSFDSCGTKYGFESAGMFSITASDDDGKAVFVKKGSAVNVQMASFREGNDYSFYYLDTVSGKWQTMGIKDAGENTGKREQLDSLNNKIASVKKQQETIYKPKKYQPGDKILNLDIDYSKVPELRPFHALIWRYAGSKGQGDPEKNNWIYSEKWQSVGISYADNEKGKYLLTLANKYRSFETVIEPVLQGKDLGIAQQQFNTQMAEYDKIMTIYKNEALRVEREANLVRSFAISQFGIYNWDKFYKDDLSVRVMADFVFDKNIPGADKATIYLIVESRNAVIPYHNKMNETFSFVPSEKNKLMAIMPDESIAVFSSSDFASLNKDELNGNKPKLVFRLRVTGKKVKSNQDVTELLASI